MGDGAAEGCESEAKGGGEDSEEVGDALVIPAFAGMTGIRRD